ncbi:MAG: ABC transporter permease [Acidimicrobiales bacterium]
MLIAILHLPAAIGVSAGGGNAVLSLAVAGIMAGALYGLIGMTLTLMLRSSGVLSFATAGFSLMAAYMYAGFACPIPKTGGGRCAAHPPVSPAEALIIVIVATTAVGLLVERFVVRPLQGAAAVTKVVATAAVMLLIAGLMLQIYGPQPRAVPSSQSLVPSGGFTVGGANVSWQSASIFVVSVVLVTLLGLYLRRSWFGLAVRASGQRSDVAQLLGVNPVTVSRFNWAASAALSALAGILLAPVEVVNTGTFAFLTVKSVGAMVLGGMVSLPFTFLGGLAIGLLEYVTPHYWNANGSSDVVIVVVIAAALVFYRRRIADLADFSLAEPGASGTGPVGMVVARLVVRMMAGFRPIPKVFAAVPVVALLLVPLHSSYFASIGVNALYYGLIALSLVVITGISGHISFVQGAFVGVGAFTLSSGLAHHWSILTAGLVSLVLCGVLGGLVGLISLRYRGVEFIILTLAIGAMISAYVLELGVFNQPILLSNSTLGINLLNSRSLYLFCLPFVLLAVLAVVNVRRSGWGRSMRTMSELGGRIGHFGLNPVVSASALMVLSAVIAGLAGCVLALSLTVIDTFQFTPLLSLLIVMAAVVGGIRSVWGALAAALIFGPGQQVLAKVFTFTSANAFPQIASAFLALVVLVYAPDGIAGIGRWAANAVNASGGGTPWWFRGAIPGQMDTVTPSRLASPRAPRPPAAGSPRNVPSLESSLGSRWEGQTRRGVRGRTLFRDFEPQGSGSPPAGVESAAGVPVSAGIMVSPGDASSSIGSQHTLPYGVSSNLHASDVDGEGGL